MNLRNSLRFCAITLSLCAYFMDDPETAEVTPVKPPIPATDLSSPGASDYSSDVQETPWFRDRAIRDHLAVDDPRYDQLNANYRKAWTRYMDGLRRLDPKLTEAERIEAREALRDAFHRDLAKSADSVITDRRSLKRYTQLTLQHRGPGALTDPDVQKQLDLTEDQRTRFKELDRDWNRKMAGWRREYGDDSGKILKRFNSDRTEIQEHLESALTREQQEKWHSLSGEPYEMPPEVYFQESMKQRPFSR